MRSSDLLRRGGKKNLLSALYSCTNGANRCFGSHALPWRWCHICEDRTECQQRITGTPSPADCRQGPSPPSRHGLRSQRLQTSAQPSAHDAGSVALAIGDGGLHLLPGQYPFSAQSRAQGARCSQLPRRGPSKTGSISLAPTVVPCLTGPRTQACRSTSAEAEHSGLPTGPRPEKPVGNRHVRFTGADPAPRTQQC
jgi:hypothetical protein